MRPALVDHRLAEPGRNIAIKPVPDELSSRTISFSLYWHERYHRDPMCVWIRQKIMADLQAG